MESTDGRVKKKWYTYSVEYYSALKKNEILPLSTNWVQMESTVISQVSQSPKVSPVLILKYKKYIGRQMKKICICCMSTHELSNLV